jgi:hypothetical protein
VGSGSVVALVASGGDLYFVSEVGVFDRKPERRQLAALHAVARSVLSLRELSKVITRTRSGRMATVVAN